MDKETKLSLLSDMIALARSSDGVNEIEYSFLMAVAEQLGISESEVKVLANSKPRNVILKNEFERIVHFHRLVLLMNIDQDTAEKELLVVKNIGLRLGLHQEAVNKVLEAMNNYPNKVVPPDVLIDIFRIQHN